MYIYIHNMIINTVCVCCQSCIRTRENPRASYHDMSQLDRPEHFSCDYSHNMIICFVTDLMILFLQHSRSCGSLCSIPFVSMIVSGKAQFSSLFQTSFNPSRLVANFRDGAWAPWELPPTKSNQNMVPFF